MTVAISQLRARLLGEEVKMAVVTPVKETVSAGKALLNMGQRLSSWVASLASSLKLIMQQFMSCIYMYY